MAIPAAALHTPITPIVRTIQIVDPRTGLPTEAFVNLLSELRDNQVCGGRVFPCDATGTNVITLDPNDVHPLLEGYKFGDIFSFIAAGSSTGNVTATVVPDKGALATLKVYINGGAAQAGNGDVVAGRFYLACYVHALDSGNGGFVLK